MGVDYQTHRCRIGYFRTVGYAGPVSANGREQVLLSGVWSQHDTMFIFTMVAIGYGIKQSLPLCVIQIQLLISGLEPNPGPVTTKSKVIELNNDILGTSPFGKRTRDFHGRRIPFVQPYRPHVSSAEVTEHGFPLFRLEINDERKRELNNKNKRDLQLREFSKVLDDIHSLGTRTELEISPLIYTSKKKQLFVMFPMSLWWKRLHFSEAAQCPNVGLAYRNDMGQSMCCTEPRFGHLENRIYTENIQSIKHDELMPNFAGLETIRHNLNRNHNSRPNLTDVVFDNHPFEFDVKCDKQQKLHNLECMLDLNGVYPQNDYMNWNYRMGSLNRFTTSTTESQREELCAAGFFSDKHTGRYDIVRCFCCGIGLKNLSDLGNPLLAHVKQSPSCPFLLDCSKQLREPKNIRQRERIATHRGFEYQCQCFSCGGVVNEWKPVEDYWTEHYQRFPSCSYAKADNGDEFINLIECSKLLTAVESFSKDDDTHGAVAVSIDEKVIQQVVEKHKNVITCDMGFPEDDVRNAVLKLVQRGLEDPDVEEIVMHLQMTNETKCLIEQFKTLQTLVPAPTGALLETKQDFCHICKQNPVDALFLPCTHHKFCMWCTERTDRCQYCGRPIKGRIRTYTG